MGRFCSQCSIDVSLVHVQHYESENLWTLAGPCEKIQLPDTYSLPVVIVRKNDRSIPRDWVPPKRMTL